MKWIATLIFLICFGVNAQDVVTIIKNHEDKSYNPRQKGLTDLVVDIISPQITKQLNDQLIFGTLKDVRFRVYWTATPERLSIEVIGMPEGFNEIKQDLKRTIIAQFEGVIPIPLDKKFLQYKLQLDPKNKKGIIAKDNTGIQLIPEYVLNFNNDGRLSEIVAKKTIGEAITKFTWKKSDWSEPRNYIEKTEMTSIDGPQETNTTSVITWMVEKKIGLPSKLEITTMQKIRDQQGKNQERKIAEEFLYNDYKVNEGEALKWFLLNN
jgi:hypothetical protein